MKIINQLATKTTNFLPEDFVHTTKLLKDTAKVGWERGKSASVNNKGLITDAFVRSKFVVKEFKQLKFETKDIPVVAAAFAYIAPIPIPGLTIYTYLIARGVTKLASFIKKH